MPLSKTIGFQRVARRNGDDGEQESGGEEFAEGFHACGGLARILAPGREQDVFVGELGPAAQNYKAASKGGFGLRDKLINPRQHICA